MNTAGIGFTREMEMTIFYENSKVGTRRVDFFVEGKIMVELKAVTKIEDTHLGQAINYLEAHKIKVGLLLNFGASSLQFRRVYNNKL
jgi:GxxExxY protein